MHPDIEKIKKVLSKPELLDKSKKEILDDYTAEEKLNAISAWAKGRTFFDSSFINSLMTTNRISEKQEMALNTIISKYRINLAFYVE